MKGLLNFKPILKDIVVHATLYDFGDIMLMSRSIREWFIHNEDNVLMHLKNSLNEELRDVKYQTKKICVRAIICDAYNLRYVKNQTTDICGEALRMDGSSLQFVKEQTEDLCIRAVMNNGKALEYVKEQTEDICLEAIEDNIEALQYVKKKTKDIRDHASYVIKKLKSWNK